MIGRENEHRTGEAALCTLTPEREAGHREGEAGHRVGEAEQRAGEAGHQAGEAEQRSEKASEMKRLGGRTVRRRNV